MDSVWLDDFMVLVEEQNFSRAAERRNVTQPAFSRRVQSLEKWVGTPLFDRLPGHVKLTPAGEQFRASAEQIARDIRKARAEALEAAGRAESSLTIAATHVLSFTFAPGWIRGNAHFDRLGTLNLVSDSMEACEQLMLNGEASFLLCHHLNGVEGRLATRQFRHRIVGADVLVPLCVPDAAGAPAWPLRPPADGPKIPYLGYSSQSGLGRIILSQMKGQGVLPQLETVVTSRLTAALLGMARSGQGVAWVPLSLAEPDITAGRLVDAGDGALSIPIEIALVRPSGRISRHGEAFWAGAGEPTADRPDLPFGARAP